MVDNNKSKKKIDQHLSSGEEVMCSSRSSTLWCSCPNCQVYLAVNGSKSKNSIIGARTHICHHKECCETFDFIPDLNTHLENHPYTCQFPGCSEKYTKIRDLKNHVSTHTEVENKVCKVCGFRASEEKSLTDHSKIHKKKITCSCPNCQAGPNFEQRHNCHHEKCDKVYNSPTKLVDHLETHAKRSFTCKSAGCGKKFSEESFLNEHIQRKHTTEKKKHARVTCDQKFSKKDNLKNHRLKLAKISNNYVCQICSQEFAKEYHLTKHIQKLHKNSLEKRQYECKYPCCSRKFDEYEDLKAHISIHTAENSHECHVCDYTTTRKDNLEQHLKTHKYDRKKRVKNPTELAETREPNPMHNNEFQLDDVGDTFSAGLKRPSVQNQQIREDSEDQVQIISNEIFYLKLKDLDQWWPKNWEESWKNATIENLMKYQNSQT